MRADALLEGHGVWYTNHSMAKYGYIQGLFNQIAALKLDGKIKP